MIEGLVNAAVGLLVSIAAVHALRAVGLWESLPASGIAAIFFGASWARSWALRALFARFGDAR